MEPARATTARRAWIVAAALCAAACILAVVALVRSGYVGISDDDASRTLIAWDFARRPSIDPTRSSWLPVHTYVLGACLAITRDLATTPRLLSLAGYVATALLALLACRRAGAGALASCCAVLGAALFAWSRWCAWAPGVPELPAAALALAALVLTAPHDARPLSSRGAIAGGLALTLACGHRYEYWFVFAAVALSAMAYWKGQRRLALAFIAAASIVPIAWLAINLHRSGAAFDFVTRVRAYRSALGEHRSAFDRGSRVAVNLMRAHGTWIAVACVGTFAAPRSMRPWAWGAFGAFAGLTWTEFRGGGATHHTDRTLLPCVWLAVPFAALGLETLARWIRAHTGREASPRADRIAVVALAVLAVVIAAVMAPGLGVWRPAPDDVSRDAVAVGARIRSERRGEENYFIETEGYAFLWVELASGAPEHARPDRSFGTPAPDDEQLCARAAATRLAAVSTVHAAAVLGRCGFVALHARGAWRLLVRSGGAHSGRQHESDQRSGGAIVAAPGGMVCTSTSIASASSTSI